MMDVATLRQRLEAAAQDPQALVAILSDVIETMHETRTTLQHTSEIASGDQSATQGLANVVAGLGSAVGGRGIENEVQKLFKPSHYSGGEGGFPDWSWSVRNFASTLSPALMELMSKVELSTATFSMASCSPEERKWSVILYQILAINFETYLC